MVLSRRWSAFLIGVGVWTWLIWPRFGLAIWKDDRAFSDGAPTSFLWVHALLITASLAIGTVTGVLGVRGWRSFGGHAPVAEDSTVVSGTSPKD
ncbi:SCO4848 family membrane protein [Actinoplanes sp. NPDC051494]|uniref:SCO4848 family membrane protein n=1 Tax=Actinoplanes sp. NPDC051494 TaxID=3363907 RepID=UPI003795DACF